MHLKNQNIHQLAWNQNTACIPLVMSSYSSLLPSTSSENDQSDDAFEIDDYLTFNEELQEGHPMASPTYHQMTTATHPKNSDRVGDTE